MSLTETNIDVQRSIHTHDPPAVDVRDLRKVFRRKEKGARRKKLVPALEDVSMRIEAGECVAILGMNGSGKSTLVRLLSTLLLNDGGSAHVFGYDVFTEPRAVRRLVNRVSVEASFFKKMSSAREPQLRGPVLRDAAQRDAAQDPDRSCRRSGSPRTGGPSRWRTSRAGCSRRSPWRELS